MTTGMNREVTHNETVQTARRWALEQLDLRRDLPPAEARPRLLKQLSGMDFMPPAGWDSALRASGIASANADFGTPALVPARRGAEEMLREDVEAFAARFFSLSPNARIAHYQEVAARCAGTPGVLARLEGLRPALELPCELPADQPPEVVELLEQVRRLAVLPRHQRAGRRWMVLKECRRRPGQCREAADIIQKQFAQYAALDAALFRELTMGGDREKLRQRIARQRRRALRKVRPPKLVTKTSSGNPWWIGIAAVVMINILRVSLTNTHHVNRPAPLASPSLNVQEFNRKMNERLQRGEPIPKELRTLYGLPPEEKASSPSSSPAPPKTPQSPNQRLEQDRQRMREMMRRLDQPGMQGGSP